MTTSEADEQGLMEEVQAALHADYLRVEFRTAMRYDHVDNRLSVMPSATLFLPQESERTGRTTWRRVGLPVLADRDQTRAHLLHMLAALIEEDDDGEPAPAADPS
jgi:hypothetical protein